jgi:predicted dehydrogenase
MSSTPVSFGIVGAGWRTEFFLRIARELPEHFTVSGVFARDATKGDTFTAKWGVPTFRTLDALLQATAPRFVVVSVPWEASPTVLTECVEHGIPALAETPPAPDVARLRSLYEFLQEKRGRIQVAEQYAFQPLQQALLSIAHSGRVGTPSQAQVSIAHGYHGISLLRKYLGVMFENATITATRFTTPTVASPGRQGPPAEFKVGNAMQTIAQFQFEDGRWGVFDFMGDQYFSFIRGHRLLVRGERGEIMSNPDGETATVRSLLDETAGMCETVQRVDTGHGGNLEGYHHRGYTFSGEWVYRNPFAARANGYAGGRLADDEIAIATALQKMAEYAEGGPDFYSLAEAAQDRYLDILIEEAWRTGQSVTSEKQLWTL